MCAMPFKEQFNPEPRADHLEQVARDHEDLGPILEANQTVDDIVNDFTFTGFKDLDRLRRDFARKGIDFMDPEYRLGHKTPKKTRDFFANILEQTAKELRRDVANEAKIEVIEELAHELRMPPIVKQEEGETMETV